MRKTQSTHVTDTISTATGCESSSHADESVVLAAPFWDRDQDRGNGMAGTAVAVGAAAGHVAHSSVSLFQVSYLSANCRL